MDLVDTHAHLTSGKLHDTSGALARASEAGLRAIICIGTGADDSRDSRALCRPADPAVYASVGIHPSEAHNPLTGKQMERIEAPLRAGDPSVVAVGETGLDYYRGADFADAQKVLFEAHLALAVRYGKPAIVHNRKATADVLEALRKHPGITGVAHCFSGDEGDLPPFLDLGFFISFAGNVTYPRAENLVRAARAAPLDNLLIETDCPYLAPVPKRGKCNEPAFVAHTAAFIAELRGLSVEDVARITTRNAERLFGIRVTKSADTIAYPIRNSLYLNITNQCSNACGFCPRQATFDVKGHNLKLTREPSVDEIARAADDEIRRARERGRAFDEIVFCGFGEPTSRLDVLKETATRYQSQGLSIRLNTNGHGSLINGRDILPELAPLVDTVSISLNTTDPEQYVQLCCPDRGRDAYDAMLAFVRGAPRHIPEVVVTAMDIPGVDVEACRRFAEEAGVTFRQRTYQEVG